MTLAAAKNCKMQKNADIDDVKNVRYALKLFS